MDLNNELKVEAYLLLMTNVNACQFIHNKLNELNVSKIIGKMLLLFLSQMLVYIVRIQSVHLIISLMENKRK